MIDHRDLRELAAGAALEDLEPDERQLLDEHIATCAACAALGRELDDLLGELALAAPEVQPPPTLHADVFGAIRTIAVRPVLDPRSNGRSGTSDRAVPSSVPVDLEALRRERTRDRRLTGGALGIAAVLAIAALGSGVTAMRLQDDLAVAQVRLEDVRSRATQQAAAMTVSLHPAHRTASLEAEPIAGPAHGLVVYIPGTTDAFLMVDALPPTPAGYVYQLWVADDEGVKGLATFSHAGGTFVAPFSVDLGGKDATMVTLEPAGGAIGEPGPQVVFGEL